MKTLIKLVLTVGIATQLSLALVGNAQDAVVEAKNDRHAMIEQMTNH